jgi:hypothetical protein
VWSTQIGLIHLLCHGRFVVDGAESELGILDLIQVSVDCFCGPGVDVPVESTLLKKVATLVFPLVAETGPSTYPSGLRGKP